MSYEAFRPNSDVNTKETTAINLTTSGTSQQISIVGGGVVLVSTFTTGCYIRFGRESTTVDTTTGFRLPAGALVRMNAPDGATKLCVLQDTSAGAVSVLVGTGI